MTRPKILHGDFERWTVTGYAGTKNRNHFWFVRCICGNTGTVGEYQLVNKLSRSCGCLATDVAAETHTKHGESSSGKRTAEYRAYQLAKSQCTNPNHENFDKFGARGIEFKFKSFEEFLAAAGRRPDKGYVLSRKDRAGNYEAGNVEWTRNKNRVIKEK